MGNGGDVMLQHKQHHLVIDLLYGDYEGSSVSHFRQKNVFGEKEECWRRIFFSFVEDLSLCFLFI